MIVFFTYCNGQNKLSVGQAMQQIQRSHIDANVPNKHKFDAYLKRDLEKYFSGKYGKVSVKWEFLREGPTQSGVAYPKYYLWTKVYENETLITEGAARVAAIDQIEFDVRDFLSLPNIKKDIPGIYQIFPPAVCETIKLRL
ncbi:hypothetical protein GCM10028808_33970 [Spirosoma migulaei]